MPECLQEWLDSLSDIEAKIVVDYLQSTDNDMIVKEILDAVEQ